MKKFLLSAVAFFALSVSYSQVYTCNDSLGFSAWTAADLDMDGNNFGIIDMTGAGSSIDSQGECAFSRSWAAPSTALNPDNLFISPAIDCSTGSGITLSWSAGTREPTADNFYAEHYAVYVVTNVASVITGNLPTPVYETTLPSGDAMFPQNVDISGLADGQGAVYVVFRHYNCSDLNFIVIDDVAVNGDFVSVEENELTVLNAYPNPTNDQFNISLNEPASSVSVMTMDGKIVANYNEINSTLVTVGVSDLEAGMYIYEVTTKEGKKVRNSFVKQ